MNIVLVTAIFAIIFAFVLGLALGFFKQFFAVKEDPLIGKIREILPGANCGACGFPGCDGYAIVVAERTAGVSSCPVGGKDVAEKLAVLAGGEVKITPQVAFVACRGEKDKARFKGDYIGVKSCRAAKISTGSIKSCSWACQGFGDCAAVCKFDAIKMDDNGLPIINYAKCTGCKVCAAECPQGLIRIIPEDLKGALTVCSNQSVKKNANICKSGCYKCNICVKNCPEQCITIAGGIPVVDYQKCTSCGACIKNCPTKVIRLFP